MKKFIKFAYFFIVILIPINQGLGQEILWSLLDREGSEENTRAELKNITESSIDNTDYSGKVYPELSIYCEENDPNISIRIDWKRHISSFNKTEIGMKIDGKNYTWMSFNLDKKGQISFQNPSTTSNELVRKFKNIRNLIVEIEPYSEPAINVVFNLSGFASHLEKLEKLCSQ